ncbi:MAG: hypothetical protein DVB28_002212 [Verrucomicrobia bacterium]|nr:MAG: hypothetical protein DVB28_002212 [Verrucomicrobiota bacterium]
MQNNALLPLQLISTGLFLLLLFGGVWILNKYKRLFEFDPDMPSENSSSLNYNKLHVIALWLHALLLTGAFALLLH